MVSAPKVLRCTQPCTDGQRRLASPRHICTPCHTNPPSERHANVNQAGCLSISDPTKSIRRELRCRWLPNAVASAAGDQAPPTEINVSLPGQRPGRETLISVGGA